MSDDGAVGEFRKVKRFDHKTMSVREQLVPVDGSKPAPAKPKAKPKPSKSAKPKAKPKAKRKSPSKRTRKAKPA